LGGWMATDRRIRSAKSDLRKGRNTLLINLLSITSSKSSKNSRLCFLLVFELELSLLIVTFSAAYAFFSINILFL
jgi:hypothetical protein